MTISRGHGTTGLTPPVSGTVRCLNDADQLAGLGKVPIGAILSIVQHIVLKHGAEPVWMI